MPKKPYPISSPLRTTQSADSMPPAGPHTSTPPPPPHPQQQQRQLRRSLRTVPSDMFSPVSSGPSSPPPPVPRRPSSAIPVRGEQQRYSPPSSTTSSVNDDDDGPNRASLFVQPLAVSRPRPDSTILPGSDDPFLLDPRHFTAVVRRGDTVQYWLPVELVIRGQPGRRCVPEGHWERLVDLAGDVSVCANTGGSVQLVTAWCHARELARNGEHVNYETTRD